MPTILIIEDDENNLILIERLLQAGGYNTLSARTGAEGLALALSKKPDAILLDIGLPDINGREVLKRLRNSSIDGTLPIIAMTSHAMVGDQEELLALGCTGYIDKPYDPETVVDNITALIGSDDSICYKPVDRI